MGIINRKIKYFYVVLHRLLSANGQVKDSAIILYKDAIYCIFTEDLSTQNTPYILKHRGYKYKDYSLF